MFKIENHPIVLMQPRIAEPRSWVRHIPFAYLAVDLLRPRLLVELGTHSGNSYLAFCQAVQQLQLDTRCVAIDSWQGDVHAQHYGEAVYENLFAYHQPRYATFSRLLKSFFDDALAEFEDGSIDLLHIDGLHTYEAVKHDFESWLPKLSDRAVVLFHDVAVRERGFGVWQFFAEACARYEGVEFEHGNGLGVLLVGADVPVAMRSFVDAFRADPAAHRGFFEALGTAVDVDARATGELAEVPADCRLYYRAEGETYDEARQVCVSRDRASELSLLQFRLPASAEVAFVRIDPAEAPGVFGLRRIALRTPAGLHAAEGRELVQRIVAVDGERLPPLSGSPVRWVGIGTDSSVEVRVEDLLREAGTDRVVEVTLEYEAVLEDPVSIRTMAEMANAFARREPSLSERLAEIERRLPLDVAHLANLQLTTNAASEAVLARANEFAPEIARTAANSFEISQGVAALHDRVGMEAASLSAAVASVQHSVNGGAQHGIDMLASIQSLAARIETLSRELDAVSQGLHTVSFGIDARVQGVADAVQAAREEQAPGRAWIARRRWWRWW